MSSLKEVKGRIISANNTLKITSAMKMVASAKLHKAQEVIEGMLPYEQHLSAIMTHFLQSGVTMQSPYAKVHDTKKRISLVIFSSNSSLCGGFNANVIRLYHRWLTEHADIPKECITVYPIGRKVADAVKKTGVKIAGDFTHMAAKPNYAETEALADELCQQFLKGETDQVELIYHHFKSAGSQILKRNVYLPIDMSELAAEEDSEGIHPDYLIEPSEADVLEKLIPEVLKLKIYTALLDSNASEHAARSMAMQIATDNANNLIQDLTVVYNKGRQQAITNELLDIVGGTMA